ATVTFSRGLFGKPRDPAFVEKVLRDLSLWDKRDAKIMTLSGGMKRRVLIAKALSHEPKILFLDEPTAGVDVELRHDMWQMVRGLRESGVTIILTTHYIEEAQEMADRIAVINKGELLLVEEKAQLMRKLGKRELVVELAAPLERIPESLSSVCAVARHGRQDADVHIRRAGPRTDRAAPRERRRSEPRDRRRPHERELARRHLCQPREGVPMNVYAIRAIYRFEMARTFRTLTQSIVSPVLSTSLYFIVFGSAIGSRMGTVDGVSYGAFIVPGLVMLSLLSESISNASFGIYLPKWSGTIFELLSAPVGLVEIVVGYVGAAATKSLMLGTLILVTARLFVPYEIEHPVWMVMFLLLTSVTFSMFGFIVGLWADSFQKLQAIPLMIVTPLTFLGGAFYSIHMLSPFWQKVTLFNPVVYLISGMRWAFYGISDVNVVVSAAATFGFLLICLGVIAWILKTGKRLKS
ncbi:MAG TPA: ABC transporter permease, partial [Kofleriaceae bacterium]|nr:ABC transporter permease [Kofleriaceae bacterium]